ncbi:lipopolysaccharide biosynthesis protein [Clostridium culturomicium]|uniref:lipopolysaccharide biosynthesis protein n=1 Tax=Clostridium culturomicium TaxID=1499683 RepID=UPI00058C6F5D|nr:capsular biosynthesis protein [Clostridium culturomicium]
MNLKGSILRVFSANFLTMLSGIIVGFIVPAILSIEAYANVKTYVFYVSYIGFMHFGFIDGMYIKYGGKNVNEINKKEFKVEHTIFLISQFIVTIIFILIAFAKKDLIIFLMALSIVPINAGAFHKLFYQATGQFKKYASASYIYTLIYLLLNVFLVVVFKSKNYIYYCLTTFIANVVVYILLEIYFYKSFRKIKGKYSSSIWNNYSVGFIVLLGNLSVMLFYAIDRWFIKLFFDTSAFAYYSFAVSMLNIINLLINAISITFYNYLAKGENEEKIKKLKNYFLIVGGFASLGYFAFSGIVTLFLKKYEPALSIIAISFAAYPYMIVINALYVNLYKARRNEKKYLKVVLLMVIIAGVYNAIAVIIWRKPEGIAIATTLSFITWYIYSIKDFTYLKIKFKECLYLVVILSSFLLFSHRFNWFIGGLGYLLVLVGMCILIFKKEVIEVISLIKNKRVK